MIIFCDINSKLNVFFVEKLLINDSALIYLKRMHTNTVNMNYGYSQSFTSSRYHPFLCDSLEMELYFQTDNFFSCNSLNVRYFLYNWKIYNLQSFDGRSKIKNKFYFPDVKFLFSKVNLRRDAKRIKIKTKSFVNVKKSGFDL